MKRIFIAVAFILFAAIVQAQNVGIGTATPAARLQINHRSNTTVGLQLLDSFASRAGSIRFSTINNPVGIIIEGVYESSFNKDHYLDISSDSTFIATFRGDGNVGIGTISPTAKLDVNGAMKIQGTNTLEFGAGMAGKETNAGKIGYQTFTPGALDIVGAGTLVSNRKVNIFAEGGTTFNGQVKITGGVPAAGKVLSSDATGLASWQTLPSTNSGLEVSTFVSQSIPNNELTKVIFESEYTDDAAAFNSVTSEFTIPSTGFYHLNSSFSFSTFLPANTPVYILLYRNGSPMKQKRSTITNQLTIDISADRKLTANDIITVYVIQNSGAPATLNIGRDNTYLSGFKVY